MFDAVGAARARGIDVVIADTAGRLPTQAHLMEELRKIRRVIAKARDGAPARGAARAGREHRPERARAGEGVRRGDRAHRTRPDQARRHREGRRRRGHREAASDPAAVHRRGRGRRRPAAVRRRASSSRRCCPTTSRRRSRAEAPPGGRRRRPVSRRRHGPAGRLGPDRRVRPTASVARRRGNIPAAGALQPSCRALERLPDTTPARLASRCAIASTHHSAAAVGAPTAGATAAPSQPVANRPADAQPVDPCRRRSYPTKTVGNFRAT